MKLNFYALLVGRKFANTGQGGGPQLHLIAFPLSAANVEFAAGIPAHDGRVVDPRHFTQLPRRYHRMRRPRTG
jgi:hypothetical protein